MPAETPNPNHEPQDNFDNFDRIISQTEWSDEAKILDTPTPMDIAASADRENNPEEAREQRAAVLAGLDGVIAETDEGKGVAVFGALASISVNEDIRQKFERVGMEHTPKPPKSYGMPSVLLVSSMVRAFPNPGKLIAAYSEKRAELAQSGMASNNEISDMVAVDKILRVVYGARYDVFYDTFDVNQGYTGKTDDSSAESATKAPGTQELRDEFSGMVDQDVWSDAAKERSILGAPTPVDVAASDERRDNPLGKVQMNAVEARLKDIIATIPEVGGGDVANRGMVMLNALTHEATNKLDRGPAPHEDMSLPSYLKDVDKPVGFLAVRMVKAFPNPGDLIDTYIERHKGEHEGKPSAEWVDQEAMEKILGTVYGERYEASKAIREAEKNLFDRVVEGVEQAETEKVNRGVRQLGWGTLRSSGLAIRNRMNDAKDRVKAVKRRRTERKAKRQ